MITWLLYQLTQNEEQNYKEKKEGGLEWEVWSSKQSSRKLASFREVKDV